MSCPYEFLLVLKGATRTVGALQNPELALATTAPQSGLDRTLAGTASMRRLVIVKRGSGSKFSYWRTSDRDRLAEPNRTEPRA